MLCRRTQSMLGYRSTRRIVAVYAQNWLKVGPIFKGVFGASFGLLGIRTSLRAMLYDATSFEMNTLNGADPESTESHCAFVSI